MSMKYCTRCVMPDTKPDLSFDQDYVCNACRNFEKRKDIDWKQRQRELDSVLKQYRRGPGNWDCIVGVSGGKDSTFQVLTMLQNDMNPLCVVASTCHLSDVGRKNIENLKHLGVDMIEFSPNPVARRKMNRIGLEQVGDISWPEHVGIFTIPVRIATQYNIPLIVWGENAQNEYGGPAAATEAKILNRRWLEEFGGLLGLRVSDLVGLDGIKERDLNPYLYPTDDELKRVGVTGIFLGYFVPWDGFTNALIAQAHGFQTHHKVIEGSAVNYENLDNIHSGIHDYFKYLKFGFGRASDLVSMHIRRGRLTRAQGMQMVRLHDGKFPWTYLDVPLEEVLKPIDMTVPEFIKICDKFTNRKLFKTDAQGNLVKDKRGDLVKLCLDNPS